MLCVRLVHRVFGASVDIERPLDGLLDEAVRENRARMIEHQAISFSGCWPQTAPDHLAIEAHMPGRPGQDQTLHLRLIPALGQHHAI
jgi:hypothetical protein